MLANYHTHTFRCHHASGADCEYVKSAIERGVRLLGFSDHAPIPTRSGYTPYYKMTAEEAPEYISSINALKKKYKNDIELHVGFEAEYYPEIFEECVKLWKSLGAEYVILAAHFTLGAEWEDTRHSSTAPSGEKDLIYYTKNCCEAMRTGKFSYIAHPDILNYTGADEALYERCVKELVSCANDMKMPLEINLLGLRTGRNYPSERFWKIASSLSPNVIFGADAHAPQDLAEPNNVNEALQFAKKYNLKIIDTIEFKPL